MNYIVIDLELNQYHDFNDGQGADEPLCPFEIIQIGAVKLNEHFEITEQRSYFIKPRIFFRMHPYVQKITGIKLSDLTDECCFDQVYDDFISFIGPGCNTLCVWGAGDITILYKNILYHKLNSKLLTKKYINVQGLASGYFRHPSNESIGLRAAVLNLNLPAELSFHDALNDAIYTARIFQIVKTEPIVTETFNLNKLTRDNCAKTHSVNSGLLFWHCERKLGRKLSEKEKDLALHAYVFGQSRAYDHPNR